MQANNCRIFFLVNLYTGVPQSDWILPNEAFLICKCTFPPLYIWCTRISNHYIWWHLCGSYFQVDIKTYKTDISWLVNFQNRSKTKISCVFISLLFCWDFRTTTRNVMEFTMRLWNSSIYIFFLTKISVFKMKIRKLILWWS